MVKAVAHGMCDVGGHATVGKSNYHINFKAIAIGIACSCTEDRLNCSICSKSNHSIQLQAKSTHARVPCRGSRDHCKCNTNSEQTFFLNSQKFSELVYKNMGERFWI